MSTTEETDGNSRLDRTCKALQRINTHAKKYADLAEENYKLQKDATAHKNSLRKDALYSLKADVLKHLLERGDVDTIEIHEINNREYYCFYLDEWSFHSPFDEWYHSNLEDHIENGVRRRLEDFTKDSESHVDISLKEALCYFNEKEIGISANYYLEEKRVTTGDQSDFAGWEYL